MLGSTPTKPGRAIHVPTSGLWYVQPLGSLNAKKLDALAKVVREFDIPGIDLSDHWELTDASLLHLRRLTHLRMLDISRTRISSPGLEYVKLLTTLTVLNLPEGITSKGLAELKPLHRLRAISLDRTRVTDEGLQALASFPHLEALDISGSPVTDAGLRVLKQLPHLKRLTLNGNITDAGAVQLARAAPALEVLDISQTMIGDAGMASIAELPALKTLYANKKLGDRGLQALAKSRSLRTLDLTGTPVTDAGVNHLADLKTLEELSLSQTSVGNACLDALAKLPGLRMIELSDTHVTSAGLPPLSKSKSLQMISLSWDKLSREDLQGLAQLSQLKTIILNGVPLPEATMAQLRQFRHASPWDTAGGGFAHAELKSGQLARPAVNTALLGTPLPAKPTAATPPVHFAEAPLGIGTAKTIQPASNALPKAAPSSRTATLAMAVPHGGLESHAPLPTAPSVDVSGGGPDVLSESAAGKSGPSSRPRLKNVNAPAAPFKGMSSEASPSLSGGPALSESGSAKTADEDALLSSIVKQSQPSKHGGYSGLAGMKQIDLAQNHPALGDIITPDKAAIDTEEKKGQFLGEINLNAGRGAR